MENAADALKMAAAILIFIVAIASSFSLFGTAKQTADSIFGMRDKQKYLDAAELDGGILYTSSSAIQGQTGLTEEQIKDRLGVTTKGDRIVGIDDVISTIYRYTKEKYGVTIIKHTGGADGQNGEVIARFDTSTEMKIESATVAMFNSEYFKIYGNQILDNIKTIYCKEPKFKNDNILNLYKIENKGNTNFKYGAPWKNISEIQERINIELNGGTFIKGEGNSTRKYEGKNLLNDYLQGRKIIEVTNEIDNSKYVEDSNLLQQHQMPTVEIVYIVYD